MLIEQKIEGSKRHEKDHRERDISPTATEIYGISTDGTTTCSFQCWTLPVLFQPVAFSLCFFLLIVPSFDVNIIIMTQGED